MGAAAGRAQLLDRVSRDGDGRAEEQERDETADQEIWPAGPEEPDRSGRGEHADVRDDVVARADPGRAQVEIIAAVSEQEDEARDVGPSASVPIAPIACAAATAPELNRMTASTSTPTLNRAMMAPLTSAARERHTGPRWSTQRVSA